MPRGFDHTSEVSQAVLDLAAAASFTSDENDIITSCSPVFESLFGYGAGDLVGRSVGALLPGLPETIPADAHVVECYIEGHRRDGSLFPLRVRAKRTANVGPSSRVGVVWAMGLADEKLHETEQMLRAVADATTAVIYIKDAEGRYIWINRRFEDLFHVRQDDMRGKTDHELFSKEVADAVRANDRYVASHGASVEFDETVPSDRESRQYISIKFPLMRTSGEVYAVCGISTDITERKRAEQRLRSTYQQLQALVADQTSDLTEVHERLRKESARREELVRELSNLIAAAHEGIWTIDVEGKTTFVNARMADMLGYTVDEMLGRSFYDFVCEERRAEAEQTLARRREGRAEQFDFAFRHKNGEAVWTIVSTNAIHDSEGRIVGVLGMLTDITARKHAEEQQKRLLQELDHRVKNSLATANALAELTMQNVGSLESFKEAFGARIQALARTHEALAQARWGDVDIKELVALVLAAHVGGSPRHIVMSGDPLRIPPRIATPLALTLNELGVNALKHGALSRPGGEIQVAWNNAAADSLEITWAEHSSGLPAPSANKGTGSVLMRGLIEHELDGTLEIRREADGLRCHIVIPWHAREDDHGRSHETGPRA